MPFKIDENLPDALVGLFAEKGRGVCTTRLFRHAMTFSLPKTLESKRALRRELASRPIAEKLRMLEAMRERNAVIRGAGLSAVEEVDAGLRGNGG